MTILTKPINFIPRKPKYMRWKKWYATKEYQDWAVTPEKLNKLIDELQCRIIDFNKDCKGGE